MPAFVLQHSLINLVILSAYIHICVIADTELGIDAALGCNIMNAFISTSMNLKQSVAINTAANVNTSTDTPYPDLKRMVGVIHKSLLKIYIDMSFGISDDTPTTPQSIIWQ